jgi:radical SAM protein
MSQDIATGRSVRVVHQDRTDRPFLVIWEATRACALACVHCRAEAIPSRDPDELGTAAAFALMDEIAAFGRPSPIFVITGGDPFERPDLADLVRYGKSIGLPMAVSPSATQALNVESLTAIRDAGLTALSLSLDGSTVEVHDAFRGIPGTFERTMDGWKVARELGLKVQINSTVTMANVHQLPEIAALVKEVGAMTWSAFMLVPTGRGTNLDAPSASQVEDIMNFLYDMGQIVPTRTTEGHHFKRVSYQRDVLAKLDLDYVQELNLGPLYCSLSDRAAELGLADRQRVRRAPLNVSSANGFVFISHTGEVHPSGFLPISAGNVRTASLQTIYRDSELFTGIRDVARLKGRCGECEFAGICGGSRSRAYAATGDLYAEDLLCSYIPGSFTAGLGIEA